MAPNKLGEVKRKKEKGNKIKSKYHISLQKKKKYFDTLLINTIIPLHRYL